MAETIFTSLIHLIQHPNDYDGKRVRVIGFASVEFEGTALYISAEHYEHSISKNGVWLSLTLSEETRRLHEKYALIEGEFDAKDLGHMRLYSGAIKNINRAMEWRLRRGGRAGETAAPAGNLDDIRESDEED